MATLTTHCLVRSVGHFTHAPAPFRDNSPYCLLLQVCLGPDTPYYSIANLGGVRAHMDP
jgi:hypothetical protein